VEWPKPRYQDATKNEKADNCHEGFWDFRSGNPPDRLITSQGQEGYNLLRCAPWASAEY